MRAETAPEKRLQPKIIVHGSGQAPIVVTITPGQHKKLLRFAERRGCTAADVVRACIAPRPGRNAAYARRAFFSLAEWEIEGVSTLAEHDRTSMGDVCARGVRKYLIDRGVQPPPEFRFALDSIRMDRIDGAAPPAAGAPPVGILRRVLAWLF